MAVPRVLSAPLLAATLGLAACSAATPKSAPVARTHLVVYELSGSGMAKASLTYVVADGTTRQEAGVTVPNYAPLQIPETMTAGQFFYFSAQNMGATGQINCTVTVDGVKVMSHTVADAYAIATCNGRL